MKALSFLTAVLVAVTVATVTSSSTEIEGVPLTWKQAALTDAAELYGELCASCHGVDARGNGPVSAALTTPAPDLTGLAKRNGGRFPELEVRKAIAGDRKIAGHGTAEMPVWGKAFRDVRPDHKLAQRSSFSRTRIFELTAYLETLQVE